MKKMLLLLILISLASCSTTNRIGSVNGMGSTIEDQNNRTGKAVIGINSRAKQDDIYYIPLYNHNW